MEDAFLMLTESSKSNNDRNKQFLMEIAAWLIDNTVLTFNQIAQCCRLALEEVQDIPDEEIEVEKYNPIISGVITEKEIDDCKKNPNRVPNDNENVKRIMQKQISDASDYAVTKFARDMIDSCDNLKK